MSNDNGHDDGFDPETGEPLEAATETRVAEPPPPRRRRNKEHASEQFKEPQAVPGQAVIDQAQAAFAAGPDVVAELKAQQAATLTVTRDEANREYEDGSRETGRCGTVPATSDYADEIARRWGGGRYRVYGTTRAGVATGPLPVDPIPGRSLSITEDDAERLEQERAERLRYEREAALRARREQAYGPGPFEAPGAGGHREQPEWQRRVWNPQAHKEHEAAQAVAKEKIAGLERALAESRAEAQKEKLDHERTKGELAASKEQAKFESLRRDMDRQAAVDRENFQKQIVSLQAAISKTPDTSQKDALALILDQSRSSEASRQAAADREARAREAEAARQQQWLAQQQAAMQAQLAAFQTAATNKNPNEVLELATKLAAQFSKQASSIEQFREFAELQRELSGKNDDDGEDEEPWYVQAAKSLPEVVREFRGTNTPAATQPPGLPAPGTQTQGQGEQVGKVQQAKLMLELIEVVGQQASHGVAPIHCAQALAEWAQQRHAEEILSGICSEPPGDIAMVLERQAGSLQARMFLNATELQALVDFASFLRSAKGGPWVSNVQAILRGEAQDAPVAQAAQPTPPPAAPQA